MVTFQAWAVHLDSWGDHTYVACPELNKYFECWGQHYTPPDQVFITSGNGNYLFADCCRCTIDLFGVIYPDTACLPVYGTDGVCHQSANRFLWTAGTTLTYAVRGYWFTHMLFGTYGTWWSFAALLTRCALRVGVEAPAAAGEMALASNPSLPDQIRDLYEKSKNEKPPPSHNEMLIREAALVTKFYAPDIDPAQYRDLHAALLADKDAAIASGLKGVELAARLNAVAAEHQAKFAERLGADAYQKLMGVPAGQTLKITEPGLEATTGIEPPKSAPEGDA